MKIGDIDRNLAIETRLDLPGVVWFDAKDAPIRVHGLAVTNKGEEFRRMPQAIADATSEGVAWLNTHTAGGRIRFRTNSPYIAVKTVMPDGETMAHITKTGQYGMDIYRSDAGDYRYVGSVIPGECQHGYAHKTVTDGAWHTYTIHMPLYAPVEAVYIGLAADAELDAPEDYSITQPILYYGSSITQGGCASRPGNAYQAMIARALDADFINLGFSGSGRAEQVICDYMATLDPSVFVSDYDHNAPDADYLAKTHDNLYETFRRAHPTTPYIMVSKPDYHPDRADDVRRRAVVRASYDKAVAAGDRHVYYIDGATLFDGDFRDSCTVDGCHPNDLGFYRMATTMLPVIRQAIEERE